MKSRFKNKKLIILASILLVIVAWVGSNLYDQAQKEKAKKEAVAAEQQYFAEAEEYIESFVEKVENVSKPDKITNTSSCRYQSRKFETGPLQCSARREFRYVNIGLEEANFIMSRVAKINPNEPLKESLGRPKSKFEKQGTVAGHAADMFLQPSNQSSNCVVGYRYPADPLSKSTDLRITFNCSIDSSAEHFPVEQ
jgi:hypothetical protein